MPDITIKSPTPVPTPKLWQDRLPDAVDWIILPALKMAVGQHDLIRLAARRPVASFLSSTKQITEHAVSASQPFQEFRGQSYHAHSQWGLNE